MNDLYLRIANEITDKYHIIGNAFILRAICQIIIQRMNNPIYFGFIRINVEEI